MACKTKEKGKSNGLDWKIKKIEKKREKMEGKGQESKKDDRK